MLGTLMSIAVPKNGILCVRAGDTVGLRDRYENGDKYLSLRWYYNPDGEQTERVVDEMPVKKEE